MIRQSSERKTYDNNTSNINIVTNNVLQRQKMQDILQQYKLNASTYEGTQRMFEIIQLSNILRKDPSNPFIQQKLQQKLQITQQSILKSKQQNQSEFMNYQFDINKLFMMNKSGSFGTIQKKCKFTEKGVLQYENEKSQPKLKEIIGFHSFIQYYGYKVRHSKLPWLKQPSGSQYRIVLVDKNKAQKAIYFTTREQASSVRVYLVEKYKSKVKSQRVKQILMSSKNQLSNKMSSSFVQKLLKWHKHEKKQKKSQQKDIKSIYQQSQQKSNKQIKLFENLNNNKSSKGQQIQRVKLDDSMFDIDRDSHPLSQFYFGEKKQYSNKNIFIQDSKTQVGFKKSSNNKIKSIQNLNENKRKFIPYGFGQKLRRYNKANIQKLIDKWRQAVQQIQLVNIENKQITGETQLFSILKGVTQRQVKKGSKHNKRGDQQQTMVLVFDKLSLRLNSNTLVPFKLQLQVQVSSSTTRGSKKEQILYTTFQSINEQQNGNLLYDLIQINNNNNNNNKNNDHQISQVDRKIYIKGGIDSYQIKLKLKQKITEDTLLEKDINLKDIKLFAGKFKIEMVELQMNNNKNDYQFNGNVNNGSENMSGLVSCQIQGKLLNQTDRKNKDNQNRIKDNNNNKPIMNNNNHSINLLSKILPFISTTIRNETLRIEDETVYFKTLLTKLPLLQQNVRRELQDLLLPQTNISDDDKVNISISSLFHLVSINQSSSLSRPTVEEYDLLSICYRVLNKAVSSLNNMSNISNNSSHLFILRHLSQTGLFKTSLQLLETFLSVIINWSQSFLSNNIKQLQANNNNNNNNNNHNNNNIISRSPITSCIGLDDNLTSHQQKLSLLKIIAQYILTKQCPNIMNKCKSRNIPIIVLVIDYCSLLLTKNILTSSSSSRLWLMLIIQVFNNWNSNKSIVHEKSNKSTTNTAIPVEIGMILIAVYLCKMAEDQLLSNNHITLDQCKQILQSQFNQNININDNHQLIDSSSFSHYLNLKQAMFSYVDTKYQQLFLSQYCSKQLQQIRTTFYTIESIQLKSKTKHRQVEKTKIINSLLPLINLHHLYYSNNPVTVNTSNNNFNNVSTKCLHLYFVTLPNISGSLYLKTSSTQFQCTQYQKNPYFIIPDLTSPIKVQFIDSKSNQYSFQLKIDAGFTLFKQQVKNNKTSTSIVFQYWAGLINQQILTTQSYTNSKQLQNSLSSSLTIFQFKQRLLKQPSKSSIYQLLQKQLLQSNNKSNPYDQSGQQMLRKVKISFTESNNKINEYELFLYLTANRKVTLREKIYSVFQYADKVSLQECLCRNNEHIKRMMVYDLLKIMSINIERQQFQAMYQQMMFDQSQSQLPKIFKAKFYTLSTTGQKIQIQLQQHVYQYLQARSLKYLHYDIDVEQLLIYVQPFIVEKLKTYQETLPISEGLLKLIVRSSGNVKSYEFKVLIKYTNRFEFKIYQKSFPQYSYEQKLNTLKPKVLRIKGSSKQNDNLDTTFSPMKKQTFNVFNENTHTTSKKVLLSSPTKKSQINMQSQSRFKDQSQMKQKSQYFMQLQAKSQHDQSIQELNLIKYILRKAKRIIPLRYGDNCEGKVMFRQFELFEQMNSLIYGVNPQNHELSSISEVYFNNVRVNDLSFLNSPKYVLQFHSDLNTQLIEYRPQIGLQNNLHYFFNTKIIKTTKIYFISTNIKSQQYLKSNHEQAKIMIDYGNSIILWQKCKVLGYFLMRREKANKKDKKMYLVLFDGRQKIIEQSYIQLSQQCSTSIRSLGQITEKNMQKWQQFML